MVNHRSQDPARPQTAKQSGNQLAGPTQLQLPVAAGTSEKPSFPLKTRIDTITRSVLRHIWRCRPLRSEMPVDPARQQSAAQSAHAGSAACSDNPRYLRDFRHERAGYRLRRALRRFWRELRHPPFEADPQASGSLAVPSVRRCPNPSVKAPCESCPGCARNGFRFPLTAEEKRTVREVFAHRLSENPK